MADYIEEELDLQDEDSIVTLTSADGEEVDFVEIAGIALRGSFYVILQPNWFYSEFSKQNFHLKSYLRLCKD